jgi:hypothetical protein
MSGFSTYQANQTINDTLVTPYASRYLALFVADPTDANLTANEVSAPWYARELTGAWASPTVGSTQNLNSVQFDPVTGAQVSISHWGIYDAPVNGNLRYSGAWAVGKTFNVDDFPVISPGDLVLNLL